MITDQIFVRKEIVNSSYNTDRIYEHLKRSIARSISGIGYKDGLIFFTQTILEYD